MKRSPCSGKVVALLEVLFCLFIIYLRVFEIAIGKLKAVSTDEFPQSRFKGKRQWVYLLSKVVACAGLAVE